MASAVAQPLGASVVAGQAQISTSGTTTVINQSTAKAIINWQDFSVGQGAAVQFNQPSASSITLNRVTGSGVSTIDGAIRANGQVWLLNPNGLLFGNGASIHVGGLLATTSDLANQDFLEGRYNFTGGRNAIVNNGTIKAANGGSVVLSAPNVANHGLIQARSGHVVLGGTDTFTVDFNGDHLLSYAVGSNAQGGQVANSGTIQAQGGKVLLTARAASGVQDAVVNNSGMVEATSVRSENGEIILEADGGSVASSGTLDASGKNSGETGGTVKVLGQDVAVADGAKIDVSGNAGGGTVLIGGNFQGTGSEVHARNTSIGKATIKADAITRGNGGKVAVWSDGRTDFAGTISARGGAYGGNGGQVETSGHDLNIPGTATVSTLAAHGVSGNWLLDPHNINITMGGSDPVAGQTFGNSPQIDANVDPAAIDVALRSGDVTLQAATDIIFNNNLTIVSAGTGGRTLTLQAGRSINLGSSSLFYATGNVVMIANDPGGPPTGFRDPGLSTISTSTGAITALRLDLSVLSDGQDGSSIGTNATPLIVLGSTPTYLKTNNASAWLTTGIGSSSGFVIGNSAHALGSDIGTGNLTLIANGVLQQAPISANSLTISLPSGISSGNPVTLINPGNQIAGVLSINAMGRNVGGGVYVSVVNSSGLSVSGVTVVRNTGGDTGPAGGVSLQAQGQNLVLLGNINSEDLVTLSAANNLVNLNSQSVILAPRISLNASAGTVGLTGIINQSQGYPIFVSSQTSSVQLQATAPGGNISVRSAVATTIGIAQQSGPGLQGLSATLTTPSAVTILATAPVSVGSLSITGSTISAQGAITANSVSLSATAGGGFIIMSNTANAISAASLLANGPINMVNTGNLTVNSAQGYTAPAATPSVNIYTSGNLTLGDNTGVAPIVSYNFVTLHAGGSISGGSGNSVVASGLVLVADSGTIGAAAAPFAIVTSNLAAHTTNKDIYLSVQPFNGSSLYIDTVNIAGNEGSLSGIDAGSGNVRIAGGDMMDIIAPATITAGNLGVSGASISLDDIAVSSFSAKAAAGGGIEVSSVGSFQLKNLYGSPAIQTTGDVSLDTSVGAITQASGAAGAIVVGTLSSFAVGGNNFNNPANAISGAVKIGSLTDTTLVNSLSTHVTVALASGTVTIVSGGDLELLAGPPVSDLSDGEGITVHDSTVLDASSLSQIGGILASFREGGDGIVLATPGKFINNAGATAIVLSGNARFLIYSADPAADTFGGLKTPNVGVFGTGYPASVTGNGSRYIFTVAGSPNRDYIGGSIFSGDDTSAPALLGFIAALQPPPHEPPPPPSLADLLTAAPPPPPPPPPPGGGQRAAASGPESDSSEEPSSSDKTTSYVVGSLEGGLPIVGVSGANSVLIPRFLRAQGAPPSGTLGDTSLLSSFGNNSLWQ